MRQFTIIWLGQIVSNIGSYMTSFAITIWLWEQTNQVTTLAMVRFFTFIPSILITLIAGMIVDRFYRKNLMIFADTIAAISTLVIICLYLTNNLQVWHFYIASAINSAFSEIQGLAYSASIVNLIPKQHYTRATAMDSALHYSSITIAPALSGFLYPIIGFKGILIIDLVSFTVAIATITKISIPQSKASNCNLEHDEQKGIFKQIIFGFHYLLTHPSLRCLITIASIFWFFHEIGAVLYAPIILARTDNNASVLGTISAAAGIGGLTGIFILTVWGGFQRRIHGFLLGMIGVGLSKTIFGFAQGLQIWLPAQFCSSLNFPLFTSSKASILLSKVSPNAQGRVFAARSTIQHFISAVTILIAGPLADQVFQPAMTSRGYLTPLFGWLFGSSNASGMALLYTFCSLGLLITGLSGYAIKNLRNIEILIPDHDQEQTQQILN